MQPPSPAAPAADLRAVALVYLTFFLDNVLLTVLVPIIPDWVAGGEELEAWTRHDAPLAALLNATVRGAGRAPGGAQAAVGLALGAKAAAQLLAAPLAGAAVARLGPGRVLRAATALLLAAALGFAWCAARGAAAGVLPMAGAARITHGCGAAGAAVAGLALAHRAAGSRRERVLGALLGAVALGVLVGYPLGGVSGALGSRAAPFLLLAAALFANLALQRILLRDERYWGPDEDDDDDEGEEGPQLGAWALGWGGAWAVAREGSAGACAGAVALTTSVMAALEPCLPPWLSARWGVSHWQVGAAFVPDSAGYLAAASLLGGPARRLGAERVALAGVAAVALAALALPSAPSVLALAAPHAALGAGLGAADAALVPALLARHPRRVPHVAALLQAASSAAYALGPALGGTLAWAAGFPAAVRTLGALNLLYVAVLYRALRRHPLSEQWGAPPVAAPGASPEARELSPLQYAPLR